MINHDDDCRRGKKTTSNFTIDCAACEIEMMTTARGDFVFVEDDDEEEKADE